MTYEEFINKIIDSDRERPNSFKDTKEGFENHHIIPKCMGGTNKKDNLVRLTIPEHLMAHVLLFRENPNNRDLAYAVHMMSYIIGAEELLKCVDSEEMFFSLCECIVKAKEKQSLYQSEFAKAQWEDEEFRKRKSELSKKQWEDAEFRNRMILANKKLWEDEEYRASRSGDNNPAKRPEVRKKMSENHADFRREKNPNYGIKFSKERREEMSKARKGKFTGADNPHARAIICIETKQVFLTLKEAAEFCNYDKSNFQKHLAGKQKTCRGLHFMYYDEYLLTMDNQ